MSVEATGEDKVTQAITRATMTLRYLELCQNQQRPACEFLSGSDMFVCLPTGSGKSLCYSLLLLASDHLRGSNGGSIIVALTLPS